MCVGTVLNVCSEISDLILTVNLITQASHLTNVETEVKRS